MLAPPTAPTQKAGPGDCPDPPTAAPTRQDTSAGRGRSGQYRDGGLALDRYVQADTLKVVGPPSKGACMGARITWGNDPLGTTGLVTIMRCGHWWAYRFDMSRDQMYGLA